MAAGWNGISISKDGMNEYDVSSRTGSMKRTFASCSSTVYKASSTPAMVTPTSVDV